MSAQAHGQLLDEHFAALRKEANDGVSDDEMDVDEDEGGWSDWEREEASDSDSSNGWENVSSDGEDIEISDSEDEDRAKNKAEGKKTKTVTRRQMDRIEKQEKLDKVDKADKMDVDEEEKEDDDDDAKSVVSAAATDASVATKKLSLLAQQKVRNLRFNECSTHFRFSPLPTLPCSTTSVSKPPKSSWKPLLPRRPSASWPHLNHPNVTLAKTKPIVSWRKAIFSVRERRPRPTTRNVWLVLPRVERVVRNMEV